MTATDSAATSVVAGLGGGRGASGDVHPAIFSILLSKSGLRICLRLAARLASDGGGGATLDLAGRRGLGTAWKGLQMCER